MPQVGIIGARADEYAAFESLSRDFHSVGVLLGELLVRPSIDEPQSADPVAGALWSAAVVAYGRCFKQGRRKGFMNRVAVEPGDKAFHGWVLAIRDQHVAHLDQKGAGEQSRVIVALDGLHQRGAEGVVLLFMSLIHPERAAIEAFRGVAGRLEAQTRREAERLGRQILDIAQSIPAAELYAASRTGRALRLDPKPRPDGPRDIDRR